MKIMKVTACGAVAACHDNPTDYRFDFPEDADRKQVASYALERLAAARHADNMTHISNLVPMVNNQAVRDSICSFMESVGMPRVYVPALPKEEDKRQPSKVAGYILDLDREVPTVDGWAQSEKRYGDLLKRYLSFVETTTKESAHV